MEKNKERTQRLVMLAILLALTVVLQLWGSAIPVGGGLNLNFVLIPIVLGGILIGPVAGAILGLLFGVIVLMTGVTGSNFFTAILFQNQPIATTVICLGKGACAGLAAGWIYRLLRGKNELAAVFAAAAAAPIVNTGLFVLGALSIASKGVHAFMSHPDVAASIPAGTTLIYYVIIGLVGVNFLLEFGVNIVVAPALHRVVTVVKKRF